MTHIVSVVLASLIFVRLSRGRTRRKGGLVMRGQFENVESTSVHMSIGARLLCLESEMDRIRKQVEEQNEGQGASPDPQFAGRSPAYVSRIFHPSGNGYVMGTRGWGDVEVVRSSQTGVVLRTPYILQDGRNWFEGEHLIANVQSTAAVATRWYKDSATPGHVHFATASATGQPFTVELSSATRPYLPEELPAEGG